MTNKPHYTLTWAELLYLNTLVEDFVTIGEIETDKDLAANMVMEEGKELLAAMFLEKDRIKQIDGVCDTFFTIIQYDKLNGMSFLESFWYPLAQESAKRLHYDLYKALELVCENNLTKYADITNMGVDEMKHLICITEDKYKKQYKNQNVKISWKEKHSKSHSRLVFKNQDTNKILKPVGYRDVDLAHCLLENIE